MNPKFWMYLSILIVGVILGVFLIKDSHKVVVKGEQLDQYTGKYHPLYYEDTAYGLGLGIGGLFLVSVLVGVGLPFTLFEAFE